MAADDKPGSRPSSRADSAGSLIPELIVQPPELGETNTCRLRSPICAARPSSPS